MTTINNVIFDPDRWILEGSKSQYFESKAKCWMYDKLSSNENLEKTPLALRFLGSFVGVASAALSITRRVALIVEELFLACASLIHLKPSEAFNHLVKSLYHTLALPVVIVSASVNAVFKTLYFMVDPAGYSYDRWKHHEKIVNQTSAIHVCTLVTEIIKAELGDEEEENRKAQQAEEENRAKC